MTGERSLHIEIPGWRRLDLRACALDLNGTIAEDGRLIAGAGERIQALRAHLDVYLLTADTRGAAAGVAAQIGATLHVLSAGDEAEEKAAFVRQLGAEGVVAVGNGSNDRLMLAEAALGIAVLGREGLALSALQAAALVAPHIRDALDLLLQPARLIATLRR